MIRKKLNRETREYLFGKICDRSQFGIGIASVEEIDTINILRASLLAMKRAYEALAISHEVMALIDGNFAPELSCQTTCVIGGDAKSTSIAAASILAKVTRDRMMCELAKEYPHYGFERHVGYGTACHLEALQTHGVTPHHRRSFAPVRAALGLNAEQMEMEV